MITDRLAKEMEQYPELKEVYEYVVEAHKNQFRKDGKTPYITHIEAVTDNVLQSVLIKERYQTRALSSNNKVMVLCLALVHDLIEDQPDNSSVNDVVKILCKYGRHEIVPDFVSSWYKLTKLKGSPDYNYVSYVLHIRQDNFAKMVKLADLTHNMSDLNKTSSLYEKYELTAYILETDSIPKIDY